MIWLVVHNRMRVDEARDDVEWWPTIVAFGQANRRKSSAFATGENDAAMHVWDLIEELYGGPPPGSAYRMSITPENLDELDQS